MVIPSYTGSFKFPSSSRSIGARKGGLFSRGNRQHARQYNFYRRYKNTSDADSKCPDGECYNSILNWCFPC